MVPSRHGVRVLRSAAPLMLAVVLGCSQGSGSADTATTVGAPTTIAPATAAPATTAAPTTTSTTLPPDEDLVPCPETQFREQFKTKVRMLRCTQTWALGLFDRDTWNCDSDGCDDTRVFKLENGSWVKKATCYLDAPLTPDRRRCYIPDVGVATDADLPPANIACKIWPENSALRWIDETGCPLDESVIEAAINTKCESWTPNEQLPLEPCDSGPMVKKMQRALRAKGYSVDIDGFNGPGTVKALARFQSDAGLQRSGIVDKDTWAALTKGP
ncbi:MAG: peptidoglycan-binding domain-containing protein [Actinomycetota bacterium]